MGKEKKNPLKVLENYRIKKIGTFNFGELLAALHEWFNDYKYDYSEGKRSEKGGATGKEIESQFKGEKKVTNYVKYHMEVKIWVRSMKDVVIERDGEKIQTNQGHIEITINSKMEKNYDPTFDKRPGTFQDFIREIYEKFIIKSKLGDYEDKLEDEGNELIDSIKNVLK